MTNTCTCSRATERKLTKTEQSNEIAEEINIDLDVLENLRNLLEKNMPCAINSLLDGMPADVIKFLLDTIKTTGKKQELKAKLHGLFDTGVKKDFTDSNTQIGNNPVAEHQNTT